MRILNQRFYLSDH